MSDTIKHLEFIQHIITRMNTNSFQIKGMEVGFASALWALYAAVQNIWFLMIGLLPTVLFWFLDAYYLQQERKFRGIYNNVAGLKNDVQIRPFEMPLHKFKGGPFSFAHVFRSKTIAALYGSILLLQLLVCTIVVIFR